MKSIQNKETEIKTSEEGSNGFYADLIKVCIKQNKQGGFDYTDIENRIAISKAIESANGTIELEDSQFNYLKKLIETTKWAFYHEDILKFKEDVTSIK